MKIAILRIVCAFLVVARCFAGDESTEKIISKSFDVEPGGELNVDVDQGDIEITTGGVNTVAVTVERNVEGGSESAQAAVIKGHKVTFSHEGKNVRVEAKTTKPTFNLFSHPDLSVHFRIVVPKRYDVTLNTAGGSIRISELEGTVDARTSGGDLTFEKIRGVVVGHTSGGNIKADNCTDKLQIQTSGGNVSIKDFSGPNAEADTSGGNITVDDCAGKLQAKTSGGNISIDKFSGASVFADTSGGTVSIEVTKAPQSDCWLRTSGGNVTAKLPADIALNLNAATDGGEVSSDLPVTVQGKTEPGKLAGKINGGGIGFNLKSSGGNIRIEKQ